MRKTSCILAGLLGFSIPAHATIPVGLIGGEASRGAYAAFLPNLNGKIHPIVGLPSGSGSYLYSVSLNSSGYGLLGGRNSYAAYASFVKPNGTLIPMRLGISTGYIDQVSINNSGLGLIGGVDSGNDLAFVAYVAQDGTVTPLSTLLNSFLNPAVSLNDSGVGLIGGEGGETGVDAYAAYVNPNGTVTQITNTPTVSFVTSVAINKAGNGIIGGVGTNSMGAYAAFVSPGQPANPLGDLPTGNLAEIYSVAINNQGNGLVGGVDENNNAFAAFAEADGTVTPLFTNPFVGTIESVAINDSNVGLIGGNNDGNIYAALREANGTILQLFSNPFSGNINSVALNAQGVGLIGGELGPNGYAALVAPNGKLTQLQALSSTITSVSIQSDIINQVVPTSINPYNAPIYTLFAASTALENRFISQNRNWVTSTDACCNPCCGLEAVTALNKDNLWFEPFGNVVHLKAQQTLPNFYEYIAGFLLGYDRQGTDYLYGVAGGYAYNNVNPSHPIGHAHVNQGLLTVYGSYYKEHFWIATALWGSYYQENHVRKFRSLVRAESDIHGWAFNPHLEIASPWQVDACGVNYIEPFFQLDWANNWQQPFTERGSSGFNVKMRKVYNSILQSEAGLRLYTRFNVPCGELCVEEKFSYVNQSPFNFHRVNTAFVASTSSFPVLVGSKRVQHLGSAQLLCSYIPDDKELPYGGFSVQVTGGSSFQSYFVGLFSGFDF